MTENRKSGMRFRQIEELLHARTQADAKPFAAADGDQGLGQLEPTAKRIVPGVHEGQQTLHTIRRDDDQGREQGDDREQPQ